MNTLPPQEVLIKLKGSALDVVSFALYVIHLVLEDKSRISVSAPFRFGNESVISEMTINEFPIRKSDLMRIVGQSIDLIFCESDGTLHLTFTNRDRLIIYANDPMYEAYTLLIEGQEYVV